MKKIGILAFLLAAVMVFAGCGKSGKIGKIDVAAAQEIALKALGIDGTEIHAASVVLCERDGVSYYDVEITVDGTAYSFAVDAVTGVIIEQSGVAETAAPQETLPGTAGVCIGKDAAYETLLKAAGFTPAHAQMTDCELKQVDGCWQYEITFIGVDQTYLGKVDATSGEFLSCVRLSNSSQSRDGEKFDGEMNVDPITWDQDLQPIPPQIGSNMVIELNPAEVGFPKQNVVESTSLGEMINSTTVWKTLRTHSGYSRTEMKVHAFFLEGKGETYKWHTYFSTPDGKFFHYVLDAEDTANPDMARIISFESASLLADLNHPLRDSSTEVILPEGCISIEVAYGYALKMFRPNSAGYILYVAEPDCSNGEYEYDFIFQNKETSMFHLVTVRATDGMIRFWSVGKWQKCNFYGAQIDTIQSIKMSEYGAKQMVLAYIPGADMSAFTAFTLDTEDGKHEYQGTVTYCGMQYIFAIDAYSGAFRTWSTQPIG